MASAVWKPKPRRMTSRVLVSVDSINSLDMPEGVADGVVVPADPAREVDEGVDTATAGPADPSVQCFQGGRGPGAGEGEHCTQGFLQASGAVQAAAGGAIQVSLATWRPGRSASFFHRARRESF
ncbi:hypothetical protein GCM10010348_70900 [Streptomyces anthocyanicus]|nr:hypothetical protein GCM10010348_70900 [Streptomyces anthocyanicus]